MIEEFFLTEETMLTPPPPPHPTPPEKKGKCWLNQKFISAQAILPCSQWE